MKNRHFKMPKHEVPKLPGYTRLAVPVGVGQEFWIGPVRVSYYEFKQSVMRLTIDSPPGIPIWRGGVLELRPEQMLEAVGPFYVTARTVTGHYQRVEGRENLFRSLDDAEAWAKCQYCPTVLFDGEGGALQVINAITGEVASHLSMEELN